MDRIKLFVGSLLVVAGLGVLGWKVWGAAKSPSQPLPALTQSVSVIHFAAPVPVPSCAPCPKPPSATEAFPSVVWDPLEGEDFNILPGIWVSAEHGDAVPNGPTGGVEVVGGTRVVFTKNKTGSKTPWNLAFWAPRTGHDSVSGGCGFYLSGEAFCRGYGLGAGGSHKMAIAIVRREASGSIRVAVGDFLNEELVRK